MCAAKLKEALDDCLISFDAVVLVTDLINDYHLPMEEVSHTLNEYLRQQENDGVKYEKRYVVHGVEPENTNKEIFQIVKGDEKMKEWLKKLKDSESILYSVKIIGGSKSPPEDFKPVTWCAVTLDNMEIREKVSKQTNGNATKTVPIKEEAEPKIKPAKGIEGSFAKAKSTNTTKPEAKTNEKPSTLDTKVSPSEDKKAVSKDEKSKKEENVGKTPEKSTDSKKNSPKDKKTAASGQKRIGNFFAPKGKTTNAIKKTDSDKVSKKSPKKLNDFFKKQSEKPATSKEVLKHEEKKSNTSIRLFDDDDDEKGTEKEKEAKNEVKSMKVSDESSDEEEELNKLRRKVADADEKEAASSSRKRLRIEDSDDEDNEEDDSGEEPQQKQGKLDESAEANEVVNSPPKSETYLDEDGFVITVKSKKSHTKPASKASTVQKTPTKSSPTKSNKTKQIPTPAAKTKQGNIMNFFKKN